MTEAHQPPRGIDMSAYWLPFTLNRYFHRHPKIMRYAKGAYYFDDHGGIFAIIKGKRFNPVRLIISRAPQPRKTIK